MDKKPLFIAGPCVIESAELLDTVAATLADINRRLGVEIIFKASFDKANRTSISSFRGQKYKNNTRKGNFLLSFLTITSKKAKNSLFLLSYLMMWSLTSSILRDVDLIILNSKLSNLITSLSLGKL